MRETESRLGADREQYDRLPSGMRAERKPAFPVYLGIACGNACINLLG